MTPFVDTRPTIGSRERSSMLQAVFRPAKMEGFSTVRVLWHQ
jgi:hypothetical protein